MVGETINILNGNMVDVRTDLSFPSPHRLGMRFEAVYNSRSDVLGKSGHGWTHTYEAVAAPGAVGSGYDLKITDETGRGHYFVRDTTLGGYRGIYQERSHVILWRTHYIWVLLDGSKYRFSTISGKLTSIEDPVGNTLDLGYDSQWRLVSVTDVSSRRMIGFKYNAQGLLQEIDGPVTAAVPAVPGELYGVWVQFGYDSAGNLASVTYADGSGFTYQYQDSLIDPHRLWRKLNKPGHLLETWDYDEQDRCIARLSNQGKGVDSIAYVSETQVDVTAAGKLRSYTIAAAGERMRVVAMIGPANAPYSRTNAVGWTYDAQTHLLSQVTFGGDTVNRYQDFDGRGNPRTVILAYARPEQRTITYTYHPVLNTPMSRTEASVLGSGSKATIWGYDEPTDENYNQNPTSLVRRVIETGSTLDQAGNVVSYKYTTSFSYNTKGQLTAYNPPASRIEYAILSYDSATSNLLSITQAIVGKTEFPSYDQAGYPLRMIDPNGETTDYGYDGRARLTRITHSDGSFRSMIYEMGVLRTQIDEDGVSQTYDYDSNGRRSRITDQENNHIDYEYDSLGNVTSMKYLSAEGVLTRWKRWSYQHPDYPGLLWKEILADPYDGASTIYDYNGAGKVETLTDFIGNTSSYAYDGFNRVTSVTQPGNVVTGYEYDRHGNLETLTDGEQHETVYTHDDMGRVVRVQSPDTGATTYVYDPASNLKTKTDALGISSTYSFDALNRLIRLSFPAANGLSAYSISYGYDQRTNGKGRLTDILDPSGSTRLDYDSRGRVHAKTSRINGIEFTMSRSFTAGGRITQFTTPAGRAVDYERSEGCACRVSRITTRGASEAIATPLFEISSYLPFGSPSGMDAGNGGSISNAFDLNGRLSTSNTGAARERHYTYYANGSLQSITASGTPWQNRTHTYDPLNQLKDAQGPYGLFNYTSNGLEHDFLKGHPPVIPA